MDPTASPTDRTIIPTNKVVTTTTTTVTTTPTTDTPTTPSPTAEVIFSCDFDSSCDLDFEPDDWFIDYKATLSSRTGPPSGQGGTGNYIYYEATDPPNILAR